MPCRVLVITPVFYGIEKQIVNVLEEQGFEVCWFENKDYNFDYHGTRSKLKFIRKIYSFLFNPSEKYIRKELENISDKRFDILFAINCHAICPFLFRKLKTVNPNMFSVVHLWDSSGMYNWNREIRYFDKAFTFDIDDSVKYGIEYKPNFFLKKSTGNEQAVNQDLFFAGKFSPYRLPVVEEIIRQCKDSGISQFIKLWPAYRILLHNSLLYTIFKKSKLPGPWIKDYIISYEVNEGKIEKDYLIDNYLSYDKVQQQLMNSNVVLDLPFPGQSGYSHRLIEAVANGKKVLTTNFRIKDESFYNPDQIKFLDISRPEIDISWIKERVSFNVNSYFAGLELSYWIKSILNVEAA